CCRVRPIDIAEIGRALTTAPPRG
ncbi:hypothetical protein, partial [Corynebacterium diphtheriae]